jgi:threonine/homoserine/homoserine lactone efflux protein
MLTIFLNFFIGLASAFIGLLPPSMLNMTAARTAIEKDTAAASRFALGASLIVIVQAFIAVSFTKYLSAFPSLIDTLQKIALVVFLVLAVFFFLQAKRKQKASSASSKKKTSDLGFGALLSTLNVLAIPYYCAVSTILDVEGLVRLDQPYIFIFTIGAASGTFSLLFVYIRFAKIIQNKAAYIARNINFILSGLSLVLFVITIFKVI